MFKLISAFLTGVGFMYLLDPANKSRRQAMARDKAARFSRLVTHALSVVGRDMSHRWQGLTAAIKFRLYQDDVTDDILIERVRAKLGHVVSHPHSVEVSVENRVVTLSGLIPSNEIQPLLATVGRVHGVTAVVNNLVPHAQTVAGLRHEELQRHWSPTTRALGAFVGANAFYRGLRSDNAWFRVGMCCAGFGLFIRSLTNGVRTIHVQKTINIGAPLESVFEFWSKPENFSRFLPDVSEVIAQPNSHYRWTVKGPGGVPVHWDSVITDIKHNELIAWETMPNAIITNAGRVRFAKNDNGTTHVDLELSYRPPGGGLGHFAARLFGSDPKSKLDSDLACIKSLFETGRVHSLPLSC